MRVLSAKRLNVVVFANFRKLNITAKKIVEESMQIYEKPDCEIVLLEGENVITSSVEYPDKWITEEQGG